MDLARKYARGHSMMRVRPGHAQPKTKIPSFSKFWFSNPKVRPDPMFGTKVKMGKVS